MVCLIPEKGLYVGYRHCLCLVDEIDSLIKNGIILPADYPHLFEFVNDVSNRFYALD